eukprot:scaffold3297_cov90-Isochrysis_galbana.AAC.4
MPKGGADAERGCGCQKGVRMPKGGEDDTQPAGATLKEGICRPSSEALTSQEEKRGGRRRVNTAHPPGPSPTTSMLVGGFTNGTYKITGGEYI